MRISANHVVGDLYQKYFVPVWHQSGIDIKRMGLTEQLWDFHFYDIIIMLKLIIIKLEWLLYPAMYSWGWGINYIHQLVYNMVWKSTGKYRSAIYFWDGVGCPHISSNGYRNQALDRAPFRFKLSYDCACVNTKPFFLSTCEIICMHMFVHIQIT